MENRDTHLSDAVPAFVGWIVRESLVLSKACEVLPEFVQVEEGGGGFEVDGVGGRHGGLWELVEVENLVKNVLRVL